MYSYTGSLVIMAIIVGAGLVGGVVLAVFWLSSRQQREFTRLLQQMLRDCEERYENAYDEIAHLHAQLSKAQGDMKVSDIERYSMMTKYVQLERELAAAQAALAGRTPSRSTDQGSGQTGLF